MGEDLVGSILILLTLSVLSVLLLQRLALPAIVAYLVVGMIAGPHGMGLVADLEIVRQIAEFGVVFLLFTLGLEFSLPRLVAMRRAVIGLGGLQVLTTAGLVAAVTLALGHPVALAVVLAGVAAVSSTAVVIKQLAEQLEINSRHGGNAVGVLLFQDLAVIPFLIVIPLLGSGTGAGNGEIGLEVLRTFALGVLVAVALFLSGRWLLRPLFHVILKTGSAELFTLGILLVVMLFASATHTIGLSFELGAFLAGLALSETRYRDQIEADIRPFRDVLLGLFFITIGMLLQLGVLDGIIGWVLLLLAALIFLKIGVVFVLSRVFGDDPRTALRTAIVLAQGGEFGFVLLALAGPEILPGDQMQIVLATIIFSMLLTPLLVRHNDRLAGLLTRPAHPIGADTTTQATESLRCACRDCRDHVVICGFGRVGQTIGDLIEREGFEYLAIDRDPARVREAGAKTLPVHLGNGTDPDVLAAARLDHARVLAICHDDTSAAVKTIEIARKLAPELSIIVRTRSEDHIGELLAAGASEVIPAELESSLVLAGYVLHEFAVPMNDFLRQIAQIRREHYARLVSEATSATNPRAVHRPAKPTRSMQSLTIGKDSAAAGRRLDEIVPHDSALEVNALRRNGIRGGAPEPETRLRAGDVLVLFGPSGLIRQVQRRLEELDAKPSSAAERVRADGDQSAGKDQND
ncbi:MAG: cation:proton antiporter [Halothiobacillaceae bacterium]